MVSLRDTDDHEHNLHSGRIMGLVNWLDHRTGFRKFTSAMLLEHVPGGARWRYVWGSCLAFVFSLQLITGVLLMTAYSPGDSTAWSSVYYIQYEMDFGWLIRGLHHFGSQTMVVLMALHLMQVVIAGAHLPPREINWWLGLILMMVVLSLGLTGYLLPWDQKGYWATQVATNIMGGIPWIGDWLRKVVIGGPEYGHQTLTRFYALHVGILPPVMILFLILHIAVFRRHGVKYPDRGEDGKVKDGKEDGWFWPDQAFRDLLVSLFIFGILVTIVMIGHGQPMDAPNQFENPSNVYEKWAHAGQAGKGANLDAPADRSTEGYPARPEWYYLFLFQLLKFFEGNFTVGGQTFPMQLMGSVIIPGAVFTLLFMLPLFGFGKMKRFGHIFGILVVSLLLIACSVLTWLAFVEDYGTPVFEFVSAHGSQQLAVAKSALVGGVGFVLLSLVPILFGGSKKMRTIVPLALIVLFGGLGYLAASGTALDGVLGAAKNADGHQRLIAEWVIPIAAVLVPFLLLFVLYGAMRRPAWTLMLLSIGVMWVGYGGIAYVGIPGEDTLTEAQKEKLDKAHKFQKKREEASQAAKDAIEVARRGIPAEGGHMLLRRDPMTTGKALFKQKCWGCHAWSNDPDLKHDARTPATATDLRGFGTAEWNYRFLHNPGSKEMMGALVIQNQDPVHGKMMGVIKRDFGNQMMEAKELENMMKDMPDDKKKEIMQAIAAEKKDLEALAKYLGAHPGRASAEDQKTDWFKKGKDLFGEDGYNCDRCHGMPGDPPKDRWRGPNLTGYGDEEWIRQMIVTPFRHTRYGIDNHMPAFYSREGTGSELNERQWQLEREMLRIREEIPSDSAVNEMKDALRDLQATMNAAKEELPKLEAELKTLQEQLTTLEGELKDLNDAAEKEKKEAEIKAKKQEIMDKEAEIAAKKKEIMDLPGKIEEKQAEITEAEDSIKELNRATAVGGHLSDVERELIIRFILNDRRVVFGGKTISGPPKEKK